MLDNLKLRNMIMDLFKKENIEIYGGEKYFLIDYNDEVMDLKNEKNEITLSSNRDFDLKIKSGKAVLETSYSNQEITDEWIKRLNTFVKIKDIINWELSK